MITPFGHSTSTTKMLKATMSQMAQSTKIRSGFGKNLELLFSTMPGRVRTPPFLLMGKLVPVNPTLFSDMEPTKESSHRLVLKSSKELVKTPTRTLNSKSLFKWSKFTWTDFRTCLLTPRTESLNLKLEKQKVESMSKMPVKRLSAATIQSRVLSIKVKETSPFQQLR